MYTTRQAAGLHAQHIIRVQACQMWYAVKLHRPSIKGTKLLLKVIKTIIINIHSNAHTPVHAGLSQQSVSRVIMLSDNKHNCSCHQIRDTVWGRVSVTPKG